MRTVMGVDQSLRGTGIFWLGEGLLGWKEVNTEGLGGAARLLHIKNAVAAIIDEHKPELVTMEGYAYGAAGKVFQLGEVGGVLRVLFEERGLTCVVVAPTQLKKYATGNAQAEKIDVVKAVGAELGLGWDKKKYNNLADAATLALIARAISCDEKPTVRHRAEVLEALKSEGKPKPKKGKPVRLKKFPKL